MGETVKSARTETAIVGIVFANVVYILLSAMWALRLKSDSVSFFVALFILVAGQIIQKFNESTFGSYHTFFRVCSYAIAFMLIPPLLLSFGGLAEVFILDNGGQTIISHPTKYPYLQVAFPTYVVYIFSAAVTIIFGTFQLGHKLFAFIKKK